jgi:DNA polymerase-3 subunit delta'
MSVFDQLVGQREVAAVLAQAAEVAAGDGAMPHAWLFTGPPGSGRSVAARAFAAALQCGRAGCGGCAECRTVLAGSHPDVTVESPEGLSYGVDNARELVRRSALSPARGRWQVVILEDADRMTERALNVLLKAIEEPPPRGVWLLCAPTPEDLLPTVRSRCQQVTLRIPRYDDVAEVLEREGVDRPLAAFVARAAQAHVGRARRLARDDDARRRRREVLELPAHVATVGGCFTAAANLVDTAKEEAAAVTDALDSGEKVALAQVVGEGRSRARGAAAAMSELERTQRSRATRMRRDLLDRALVDLASMYRDVLIRQLGADVELVNPDLQTAVDRMAESSTPESTLRRVEAVLACREAVEANVAPLLAVEAMALALREG